jgi:hypothetical protein
MLNTLLALVVKVGAGLLAGDCIASPNIQPDLAVEAIVAIDNSIATISLVNDGNCLTQIPNGPIGNVSNPTPIGRRIHIQIGEKIAINRIA